MDLSIVIVSWNTRDLLRDCLTSVFRGLGPLAAEVWVVDNGSTDGSPAMLAADFPQVRLIANADNRGFAAANNQALSRAAGRYLLLLNTDTLVHGAVLPDAVAWLDAHPGVGVMGPRILNADGTLQGSASAFPTLARLARQTLGLHKREAPNLGRTGAHEAEVISGCAMVVRAAAMAQVGLLDEAFFFYGEETDWCRRFARAGWGVMFAPVGEITHFGGGSVRCLNHRRDLMLTEGTVRLHAKHSGLTGALACYALLAVFNASRAVGWAGLALLRRNGARARARHFAGVVAGYGRAWPRGAQS
ncbi:glycosyltransferase family 2 protein [Fertoebacter nigrum]|uniref:Glycosyltransferase family 2 protein n=1 Tax=Fertoeibacter niger TaxID=2656921 RepID=A0A8X8H342_9RHOB|nr:glycosyltransferase family 2 protein [Fertoeibacter niger]NUB46451.1 glycosyltransferase family 2 protein [Fertoeibacter niger]